jgi:flagellar basal-body rod modification protein FlgD
MSIDPVGATTTSSVAPQATSAQTTKGNTSKAATADYNQFLKLLMTELKYQDPSSPSDPTQYVSQLATFSAVEQQTQTNTKLGALLTSNSIAQANSLIGRTIESSDQSVSGKVVAVHITADGSTATLEDGSAVSLGDGVTIK